MFKYCFGVFEGLGNFFFGGWGVYIFQQSSCNSCSKVKTQNLPAPDSKYEWSLNVSIRK